MPTKNNKAIDAIFSGLIPDWRMPKGYTVLKYGMLLAIFLYILSYALLPFTDGDPAYYTILGRGMLRDHLLPYHYAFDHKPFGIDLFYGLWDLLTPFYRGKFTLLALILSGVFVCLCRTFGSFSRRTAFVLLIVGGSMFNILSGNSELILLTGEALCLTLMFKGVEQNRQSLFFIAGFVAAFIVNVNYLAALCLLAPAALLLLSPGWFCIARCCLAVVGGIIGLIVLFMPYFVAGHGDLQTYFFMQRDFLHHYSGSLQERLLCLFWTAVYVLLISPVLIAWCRRFSLSDWTEENRKNLLLPLWFCSSLPATMLSGHPFSHYFLLCFAPAVIMWTILLRQGVAFSRYAFVPFFILAMFYIAHNTVKNFHSFFYNNLIDYTEIRKEIGEKKVLNIRAYQTLFYMSDLRPFDIYLFHDHLDILYGQLAWQHYMQDLAQNPPYLAMPYDGCARHEVEAPVCQWIQTHYRLIYAINVRPSKPHKLSFSLYKLVTPGQE